MTRATAAMVTSVALLGLVAPTAEACTPGATPASVIGIRDRVPDEATWQKDIEGPIGDARAYVEQALPGLPGGTKPAITLDIDNTSLASHWHKDADTVPPAKATFELTRWAKQKGVAIFFVTARSEDSHDETMKNLQDVGYPVDGLYMKTDDGGDTAHQKEAARRDITDKQGFRIVANIGNNDHDIAGGYQDKGFLLPNYGGELS